MPPDLAGTDLIGGQVPMMFSVIPILAPRGTPDAVLEEIRAQIARVAATREYRERIEFEGAVPLEGTPAEFAALIRAQGEKWGKLIRAAGIKPE